MRNIWLVIKHDVKTALGQRTFWVFTLLIPLLMVALSLSRSSGASEDTGYDPSRVQDPLATLQNLPALGLVDRAGLLTHLPPGFPPNLFVRFSDQEAALAALKQGQVQQVVAIPADFLANGKLTIYAQNFQMRNSGEGTGIGYGSVNEWLLPYLINYNLTGDAQLVAALRDPVPGALARPHRVLPAEPVPEVSKDTAELVSAYLPYLFYFLLLLGSNYLMRSVIAEKENRTAEVLLLSLQPRQLMAGKILAGSALVIIQLVVWLIGASFAFNRSFLALDLSSFRFPPGFFLWAAVYLVFGYLLFAAVMAAGGALAVNPREVGQMTFLLVIPLMPTLMFGSYFIEEPDSLLTVGLSLFPFSAPSVMVTRLAFGPVPLWQLLASLALLAATTYLFLALAGRFFQVGNLLSAEAFRWGRLLSGWRAAPEG
jgi:ABC-2 type transport system permease protein